MVASSEFPTRHAISRSRFFFGLARDCSGEKRDEFEAFLEAAIVFARTAILRVERQYKKHPDWKPWWDRLLSNTSLEFIREERNWILHEAPPKIGQIIRLGAAGGGAPPAAERASELYFYETGIPATDTVGRHIDAVERAVNEADSRFGKSRGK